MNVYRSLSSTSERCEPHDTANQRHILPDDTGGLWSLTACAPKRVIFTVYTIAISGPPSVQQCAGLLSSMRESDASGQVRFAATGAAEQLRRAAPQSLQ